MRSVNRTLKLFIAVPEKDGGIIMKDPSIKLTIDTTDLDKTIEKIDLLIKKLKIAEQLSKSVDVNC